MKTQLNKNKINKDTIAQAALMLDTILIQNYLKFNNKFFQPHKGVAMGSPISGLVAEIFLQHHKLLKSIIDIKKIIFYNRYVDDVIIIYDERLTNSNEILNYMDNIHPELHFKVTDEENNNISFLDLLITKENNRLSINIYRKPTATDTTIHYRSNHPMQYKLAAYRFMFNRLYSLPLSQDQKNQEINTIVHIAKQNGYPIKLIEHLNTKIRNKKKEPKNDLHTQDSKKWIIFGYYSHNIRKLTNIFRNTPLQITYRAYNTIKSVINPHIQTHDEYTNSGIYSLRCNTCHTYYIGQTGIA